MKRALIISLVALGVIIAISAGVYVMSHVASEEFLKEYNGMNGHYKNLLFSTGQGDRETSMREHALLTESLHGLSERSAWNVFSPVSRDGQFNSDMDRVAQVVLTSSPLVAEGNLTKAHLALEQARPIMNEMLRRNGLSAFDVALVDFHDAMETAIEHADKKDAPAVLNSLALANDRLVAVETEGNSTPIQDVRASLEALRQAALKNESEKLPGLGAALKKSFQKAYLTT